MKTYSGSCHCGSVRYQAEVDLAEGTNRCNCSVCSKSRAWFAFAKGAERFRLVAGADSLFEYRWTPPGMAEPFLTYCFCGKCGIRVFAKGGPLEALGGTFHAVQVMTLDDADPNDLAAAPVNYVDGLHGRFDRAPADTRLM
ncbi:MAG TPA: GFA family protein [Polyangiaceae bacterium]